MFVEAATDLAAKESEAALAATEAHIAESQENIAEAEKAAATFDKAAQAASLPADAGGGPRIETGPALDLETMMPSARLRADPPLARQMELLQGRARVLRQRLFESTRRVALYQTEIDNLENAICNQTNRLASLAADKVQERAQLERVIESLRGELFTAKRQKADADTLGAHWEVVLKTCEDFVTKLERFSMEISG